MGIATNDVTVEAIEQALCVEFEQAVSDMITTWPQSSALQQGRVKTWIDEIRDDIVNFARDVQDPEQLRESMGFTFVELYSKWLVINVQYQYQTSKGIIDLESHYRNTCLSLLLHTTQRFCDKSAIEEASAAVEDMGLRGAARG